MDEHRARYLSVLAERNAGITMRPDVALPDSVLTLKGWLPLEHYVARVCSGEMSAYTPFEAIAAQAIAARTYVARAMRDHPTLGKTTPLPNGPQFQAMADVMSDLAWEATERTRGKVILYQNRLTLANYVAGAYWTRDGFPGNDPTSTEKWVTYNAGKRGSDVRPTGLSLRTNPGNRGCMSQNGAIWLASNGYHHLSILRFFYGDDIEVRSMQTPRERAPDALKAFSNPIGAIVVAAMMLMLKEGL